MRVERMFNAQTGEEERAPKMGVTIVAGPPGSGKSTLVRERMRSGDLVVDMDLLFTALSGGLDAREASRDLMPFVASARDAVLQRVLRPRQSDKVTACWIVSAWPDPDALDLTARRLGAHVEVLRVESAECKRRLRKDARPRLQELERAVDEWWNAWHAH